MTQENSFEETTIGEIVAADFRAAEIFRKEGIDFCCGGKKRLSDACREKSVDASLVVRRLKELEQIPSDQAHNYRDWDPGFLADYIVNTHHKYIISSLPELVYYTQKIASVQGSRHPELIEVADLFGKLNNELLQHLEQEENVLFPAIREAVRKNSPEAETIIRSEIGRMTVEHEIAGDIMDRINRLTSGYLVPEDGCNTYGVTFRFLRRFEEDLHVHVHLENNILFPKALEL